MSKQDDFENEDPKLPPPLDLSKWRALPSRLMAVGGLLSLVGLIVSWRQPEEKMLLDFGYSWLLAFMFFLSIALGAMFLVLMHHLFDAGWSLAMRRFCEHISSLLPWMALLFIPIVLLATKLYPWLGQTVEGHTDHATLVKKPLFTVPGFYVVVIGCFAVWWLLSNRLRFWSLRQDATGEARCTFKMRMHASWGIWAYAFSVTLAAIMWMKALQHHWFSTMYGVWYFAGSVWLTLATVYVITLLLDRQRILSDVLHEHQYYFLGSLLFAFTVFYAYVTFAQYFIIWNANMPEETFWYVIRERGTWFWVSMIIIFGHFFVPFLALLRIDVKLNFSIMVPLCIWAWLMHFFDLAFNIFPVYYTEGFPIKWAWLPLGCMAFMGGFLAKIFLRKFASTPPYPNKDPRMVEAMGLYHPIATPISGGEMDQIGAMGNAPIQPKGSHS